MPLFGSFFSDFFDNDSGANMGVSRTATPAVNVKETDKEFVLEISAPGIPKEDIDVNVENNMLTISGDHK
jgi:HSP20 family protein